MKTYKLNEFEGEYRYRSAAAVPFSTDRVATAADGALLYSIINRLPWTQTESAILLAGWLFLAPICGLLKWRPSIWMCGERGCGKTYVGTDVIARVLGRFGVFCKGESTEAGIRQELGGDAYPVVIDEAEGSDEERRQNITRILNMIRQSSSAGNFAVLKGSSSGAGIRYALTAMFCLLSISPTADQAADVSRIAVLELRRRKDSKSFRELRNLCDQYLTPEMSNALVMRAVTMWPVIRETIEIFSEIVADVFDSDARLGDQYGTLLAGAWCLAQDEPPSVEKAIQTVKSMNWSDASAANADTDAEQCLRRLMQYRLSVRVSAGVQDYMTGLLRMNNSMHDTTVGELVAQMFGLRDGDSGVPDKDAAKELRKMGLWVREVELPGGGYEQRLLIANKHERLREIFAHTPWTVNWNRVLSKLSPDTFSTSPLRFTPSDKDSTSSRALAIPQRDLFGLNPANDNEQTFIEVKDAEGLPWKSV